MDNKKKFMRSHPAAEEIFWKGPCIFLGKSSKLYKGQHEWGKNMEGPKLISKSLLENTVYLRGLFEGCMDFMMREFKINGINAALTAIDGLVNKQTIAQAIMTPIWNAEIPQGTPEEQLSYLRDSSLSTVDQTQLRTLDDVMDRIFSGFAVLLMDGCDWAVAFGVQGFQFRGISEPSNEVMQRGSREGFVEPYLINISMIRRRMKTSSLKFEKMEVGSMSKTSIALCYLQDMVSQEVLEEVRANIHKIHQQSVLATGYLAPFLEKKGVFNGVGLSERPDTVCGKIMEGRIAIIVDGTPNVLIVPHLFIENFQSYDDYTTRPYYATFTRCLKVIAFFFAMFLPGLYVATVTFHPDLLPEAMLIKIAQAEASTPFPVMIEAVVIHLIYEIMREAGLRVPRPLSHAVSIVGALVIGDTAVSSGLIGTPTLLVVALTALSSYAIPSLYEPIALLRFAFIIIGGTVGLWGITLGMGAVAVGICAESVYKIPFSAPVTPFRWKSMRDVFVRAGWRTLSKKTITVQDMPGSNVKKL